MDDASLLRRKEESATSRAIAIEKSGIEKIVPISFYKKIVQKSIPAGSRRRWVGEWGQFKGPAKTIGDPRGWVGR
jgi:hypothetical protein